MKWKRFVSHSKFMTEIANGIHPNEMRVWLYLAPSGRIYKVVDHLVELVSHPIAPIRKHENEDIELSQVPNIVRLAETRIDTYLEEVK